MKDANHPREKVASRIIYLRNTETKTICSFEES